MEIGKGKKLAPRALNQGNTGFLYPQGLISVRRKTFLN